MFNEEDMLSEQDKVQIRAEEQAKLEQEQARLEVGLRLEAAAQYREEVARALKGGPGGANKSGGRRWGWVVAGLLLTGTGLTWWLLWPSSKVVLEPLEAAFVQSCETEVTARVGEGWTFPPPDQIKVALSVSAEGRSWQGFVAREGRRQSFSCLGATVGGNSGDGVRLELFGEEPL